MAVDIQNPIRGPVTNLQTELLATVTVAGAQRTVQRTALIGQGILARARINVVNAGTPTLDVDIEDSWNGTDWNVWISLPQLTVVSETQLNAARLPGPFVRSNAIIAGTTPDIDFQVDILGVEFE